VEGKDYRIPSPQRFSEWRLALEPAMHYVAVKTVRLASRYRVCHDASTKKGVHILHTCVTVEVDQDGKKIIARLPVKFEICPSGKAAAEAAQVQSAFHCAVGDGQHASLLTCVSGMSDAAAKSTTRQLEVLKKEEIEAARQHVESGVAQCPQIIAHAMKHYLTLTPEQRNQAHRIHVLFCANHAINLVAEAGHKKSEVGALEAAMVMDRAATTIQRRFCSWSLLRRWTKQDESFKASPRLKFVHLGKALLMDLLRLKKRKLYSKGHKGLGFTPAARRAVQGWRLSPPGKHLDGVSEQLGVWPSCLTHASTFATTGVKASYYLNCSSEVGAFERSAIGKLHRKSSVLPSPNGSTALVTVQLPTAVLSNTPLWLAFLALDREDLGKDTNELIVNSAKGLKDKYVNVGLRARSFRNVVYVTPLFFFLNAYVGQHELRAVNDIARDVLERFGDLSEKWKKRELAEATPAPAPKPKPQDLAKAILSKFPQWTEEYTSWWKDEGPYLEEAYETATESEFWYLVKHVIAAGADDALTTHTNNVLEDTSLKPELEHAGVNSNEVESGFGNVDFTGHQLGTCGTVRVFGVAQARKPGAFL
jgi:hypothetical protein